jgi:hypothetical protein
LSAELAGQVQWRTTILLFLLWFSFVSDLEERKIFRQRLNS